MHVYLLRVGIDPDYNPWVFHGEEQSLDIGEMEMSEEEGDELYDEGPLVSEEMASLVHDATNVVPEEHDGDGGDGDCSEIPDKFYRLMKDAEEELCLGCKTFSRLEFIVTLLHLKVISRREMYTMKPPTATNKAQPEGSIANARIMEEWSMNLETQSSLSQLDSNNNSNEFVGSTSQQPKKRKGPFRGPSRALKYKKLQSIQPGKLKVNIPPALGAVVGERENQFVAECAYWVKEIFPLDVPKWSDMPEGISDRLYARIKEGSEKNRANALAKKIKLTCGAKSTTCIIYELELEAQACENENEVTEINGSSSNVTTASKANDDPMYLKLWEKSKRHKNGKFDDEAEEKFKELRELHEKEISEKGVDNLTLEEAYVKVLGHRSGYARGLGKGHPVSSKDGKIGRAELEHNVEKLQNENNIMRAELEASKKKQEDLEQKLRLIMEKIGLDA
uniref:Transposase n=1 Tax=Chenopodium quinoa TaxID=63459 RepID=A0A803KUL4_CHEQI